MSDRWAPIRRLAATARAEVRPYVEGEGRPLVRQAVEDRGLEIMVQPHGDPLLHGCRAVVNEGYGYVAVDGTLPAQQATFALAHELGHLVLGHVEHLLDHPGEQGGGGQPWLCTEADIDESASTERLSLGSGSVQTYNARQQRELEANVFATAFLLPTDELRARFAAGQSYRQIATHFGVSPAAALNALCAVVLDPFSVESVAQDQKTQAEPPPPEPDLDESQERAATVPKGPVLVNAGPGTGKTRTLVARVAHLVAERGVPAGRILAVTFSNRASNEMRARLERALPGQAHQLTISTFHAFCLELLRRYHDAAGLPADFRVIDQIDTVLLLERHLAELDLEEYLNLVYPEFSLRRLVGGISRAKSELVTPERYAALAADALRKAQSDSATGEDADDTLRDARRSAEVARVYAVYERLLSERGLVDFGGLIMRAVRLLEERPDVRAQVQGEYAHILVDEYQDMNRASARLLRLIAGEGEGLWVVGDLRQSIYQFRGAAPHNITRFTEDFSGGATLDLEVNYRSASELVRLFGAAGSALTLEGAAGTRWRPATEGEPRQRVWVAKAGDGVGEAEGIAEEVRRRHAEGRPYGEQAILVRAHAHAEAIVTALEKADVPVLYLGDLFAREEVRDLLALVTLVAERDWGSLLRLLAAGDGADAATRRAEITRLIAWRSEARAQQAALSADQGDALPDPVELPAALARTAEAGLSADAVAACEDLRAAVALVEAETEPWSLLARYLFGHGAVLRRLMADGRPVAQQRLAAIGQLLAVARAFQGQTVQTPAEPIDPRPIEPAEAEEPGGGGSEDDGKEALRRFLGYVRRLVAMDENGVRTPLGGEGLDAVRVLTVHASKGLEFPVVYVPCLVSRRFPAGRRGSDVPALEGLTDSGLTEKELHDLEEQCLFFVAISRAREELVLTRAAQYGRMPYKAQPLLDLLEGHFAEHPPVELAWPSRASALDGVGAGDGAQPGELPFLRMRDLEVYLDCPRRYEYQQLLHLEERLERQGYKRFHDCVHRVLGRLRSGEGPGGEDAGGPIHDSTVARAVLDELWPAEGPTGHAYEGLYRALADRLVAQFCASHADRRPGKAWRKSIDVQLGGTVVRVPIDDSEVTQEGVVRLIRRHTGKENRDHKTDERLALLREGAARALRGGDGFTGAPVAIALEYVATGDVQEVPYGKNEQKKLLALEDAIRGIAARHFPARPRSSEDCATCPFWVVCPR